MRWCRLLSMLVALHAPASPAASSPEKFAARPQTAAVVLSPNGRNLAIVQRLRSGAYGLYLYEIDTGKARQLISPKDEAEVASVRWLDDDWVTFQIGNVYGQYGGYGRLDIRVTQIVQDKGWYDDTCGYMDSVRAPPRRDGTAWMICWGRDGVVARRQDLVSGKIEPLMRPTPAYNTINADRSMGDFVLDHQGRARAAIDCVERVEGQACTSYYREDHEHEWRPIARWTSGAPGALWPGAFDPDDRTLYVYANPDGGPLGVYRWDSVTGVLGERVFGHPEFDVEGVVVSRHDRRLVGVRYNDGRSRAHWVDPARAALEREIGEMFPGESIAVEFNDTGDRALVFVSSDRNPGEWHLYLAKERELRAIGKRSSVIDPGRMAQQRPISYPARDGLTIHGYLTLPPGHAGGAVPLVVNPHGGPFGVRDRWGFDPEVQFLASLGYGVLQINFRGSAGYGEAFVKAGWGQWGLKMQDDITDGVRWAIDQGHADPDRICIYGASYGGYAALMGLIKTPELYRCGVDYAGVADLVTLYREGIRRYSYAYADLNVQRQAWFRRMIGGDREGEGALSARSPVHLADRIRAPLLIAHGKRDGVVLFNDHAALLRRELEKRGRKVDWLEFDHEGHGFRKPENVLVYYRKLEAFLAEHLAPRGAATQGPAGRP